MKPKFMIWSERVKRVRQLMKLTQQELADVLKIRRETVTLWEARADRPFSAGVERFLELESRVPADAEPKD
jgi:DNA-binding transcriptional regulator YiaG